jgi:outer membrane protein assembly factor BamD
MKRSLFLSLICLSILLVSCKSEFEKIRASGDTNRIYQRALAYYDNEEYQKAQTLFELVVSSFRGQQEAEDIYFKYAYTYYYLGQYILASYYFNNFSNTYSTSEYREEADFMAAHSNYQMSPTFRLDQTETQQAIEGFQLFVNTFPNSERVGQCNRLIDEMRLKLEIKAYEGAKLYYDLREYQAAIQSFENVLKDFPDTDNAQEIRFMVVKSAYLLAKNSFVEKQKERYEETLEKGTAFISRYPESRFAKEVNGFIEQSRESLNGLTNVRYQNKSTGSGS